MEGSEPQTCARSKPEIQTSRSHGAQVSTRVGFCSAEPAQRAARHSSRTLPLPTPVVRSLNRRTKATRFPVSVAIEEEFIQQIIDRSVECGFWCCGPSSRKCDLLPRRAAHHRPDTRPTPPNITNHPTAITTEIAVVRVQHTKLRNTLRVYQAYSSNQHNAVETSAAQRRPVQHRGDQCSAVQTSKTQWRPVQRSEDQCSTEETSAAQCRPVVQSSGADTRSGE